MGSVFGFHIKEMKPGFIMSPSLKTFVALYSIGEKYFC
jgi:hypothetical protein